MESDKTETQRLYASGATTATPTSWVPPWLASFPSGKVEGYGGGVFRHTLLVPLEEGQRIQAQLNTLRADFEAAQQAFKAEWDAKLDVLPEALRPVRT